MEDLSSVATSVPAGVHAPSETAPLTAPDGLVLFTQAWRPAAPPRAVVALVHGYAEHSGRYAHVAAYLADKGYAVHAFDLRGHGRSEGRRGDVERFDRYLDDLGVFLARLHDRYAEVPLFLMGHSMGGTISARYSLTRGANARGLILSSPALRIGEDAPALLRRLAPLLARLFPLLPTVPLRREFLSRDPAVVAAARRDPLNYHGRVRARLGAELMRAAAAVRDRMEALTPPLLVIQGTADGINNPRGSIELYLRAGAEDKTLGLYEGLYHETLNEPEHYQVFHEISTWLEEHL